MYGNGIMKEIRQIRDNKYKIECMRKRKKRIKLKKKCNKCLDKPKLKFIFCDTLIAKFEACNQGGTGGVNQKQNCTIQILQDIGCNLKNMQGLSVSAT